ncbi:MAG: hypothetical protein FWD89_01325 [Firmicutes bacterium]|nr:hypothetical protein [Bacillota bacterium]
MSDKNEVEKYEGEIEATYIIGRHPETGGLIQRRLTSSEFQKLLASNPELKKINDEYQKEIASEAEEQEKRIAGMKNSAEIAEDARALLEKAKKEARDMGITEF